MGWGGGGDENGQVKSKTDLRILSDKRVNGVGWGGDDDVQVICKTDLRILQTKGWVGWGGVGVGMITYRSRARQT